MHASEWPEPDSLVRPVKGTQASSSCDQHPESGKLTHAQWSWYRLGEPFHRCPQAPVVTEEMCFLLLAEWHLSPSPSTDGAPPTFANNAFKRMVLPVGGWTGGSASWSMGNVIWPVLRNPTAEVYSQCSEGAQLGLSDLT